MTCPQDPNPPGGPPHKVTYNICRDDIEGIVQKVLRIIEEREAEKQAGIPPWKKGMDFITQYWFLTSVIIFIIACLVFGASVLYPFKQFQIADQEVDQKQRKFEFEQKLAPHFLTLANELMNIGKYQDAAKAYGQAIKLDAANIEARFGLQKARLLDRSEEKQFDAEVIARRIKVVQRFRPDDSHALAAKAQLDYDTGDKEAAKNHWNDALKNNPKLAQAHFGLAILAFEDKRYDDAVKSLKEATTLAPLHWQYQNNLASALTHQKSYKEALPVYQKVWALDPDALLPYLEGARALLFSGHMDNALMALNRLIAGLRDKKLSGLKKNQGVWFFSTGGGEAALSGLPMKQAYAYQLRSVAHHLYKSKEQAGSDFQTGRSLAPKDQSELKTLLAHDLKLLIEAQPGAAERINKFQDNYF
jgi:tetratricopeptide (TPR) repeat protein